MMMIVQIIVMISIIIMSVLGNLLVLISVLCNRALRQPPNLLLLSLAVTDMLVSLLVMPGRGRLCVVAERTKRASHTRMHAVRTHDKVGNHGTTSPHP